MPGDNPDDVIVHDGHPYRSKHTPWTAWRSFALPNPRHDNHGVEAQMAGGMKGFLADYAHRLSKRGFTKADLQLIMNYYGADELKAYTALVKEFAICDHWFCSHIGGTLPNRYATLCGSLNVDYHGRIEIDNSPLDDDFAPSEMTTFFDHLTDRGVSWKLYEHGYSLLRLYAKYTFDTTNVVSFKDGLTGFHAAAAQGTLPSVSFIEPDYIELPNGNDDHAPADMKAGQKLIAGIVKSLVNGPLWEETLLIITYDEHGGFYDHMLPPTKMGVVQRDGTIADRDIPELNVNTGLTTRLGPRVPAFVISPYVEKGANGVNLCKTVFDHTTIPATILRCFCSPNVPRMSPRADKANDLRGLLTLDDPRPASDFAQLLSDLEAAEDDPPTTPDDVARIAPIPLRKPVFDPDYPDEHPELDDFGGFVAYATAVTGRGS